MGRGVKPVFRHCPEIFPFSKYAASPDLRCFCCFLESQFSDNFWHRMGRLTSQYKPPHTHWSLWCHHMQPMRWGSPPTYNNYHHTLTLYLLDQMLQTSPGCARLKAEKAYYATICLYCNKLHFYTIDMFRRHVERLLLIKRTRNKVQTSTTKVLHQYTVVFAWKCRLFCLCAHGQCRIHHIYHVEFNFWYHFRFNISCGRSRQKKMQVIS